MLKSYPTSHPLARELISRRIKNIGKRKGINELARKLYDMQGYQVVDGYRFDLAHHPQEALCWRMAEVAINFSLAKNKNKTKNNYE